uniref:Uncharacterized protein n=1 Tax=Octopus bimaculoides TaxID=37653 RepID=A0A0L8FSN0_OCTBM
METAESFPEKNLKQFQMRINFAMDGMMEHIISKINIIFWFDFACGLYNKVCCSEAELKRQFKVYDPNEQIPADKLKYPTY